MKVSSLLQFVSEFDPRVLRWSGKWLSLVEKFAEQQALLLWEPNFAMDNGWPNAIVFEWWCGRGRKFTIYITIAPEAPLEVTVDYLLSWGAHFDEMEDGTLLVWGGAAKRIDDFQSLSEEECQKFIALWRCFLRQEQE